MENNVFAFGQGKKVNKVLVHYDVIALFLVTYLSRTCENSPYFVLPIPLDFYCK